MSTVSLSLPTVLNRLLDATARVSSAENFISDHVMDGTHFAYVLQTGIPARVLTLATTTGPMVKFSMSVENETLELVNGPTQPDAIRMDAGLRILTCQVLAAAFNHRCSYLSLNLEEDGAACLLVPYLEQWGYRLKKKNTTAVVDIFGSVRLDFLHDLRMNEQLDNERGADKPEEVQFYINSIRVSATRKPFVNVSALIGISSHQDTYEDINGWEIYDAGGSLVHMALDTIEPKASIYWEIFASKGIELAHYTHLFESMIRYACVHKIRSMGFQRKKTTVPDGIMQAAEQMGFQILHGENECSGNLVLFGHMH